MIVKESRITTKSGASTIARRLCDELHTDPEHLTLVIHQKDGSTHGHLVLPEWQQDHVLESRFTWIRMEKVAGSILLAKPQNLKEERISSFSNFWKFCVLSCKPCCISWGYVQSAHSDPLHPE
ncbi:hypothetical protein [Acetobacter tropicalis]|nr:hypothetical protein [Acetobacter tropicalis]